MVPTPPAAPRRALGAARAGLITLTLINLLNYLDRFLVAALVESSSTRSSALSDTQLGSLMTGFIIVYTVASPVFGVAR